MILEIAFVFILFFGDVHTSNKTGFQDSKENVSKTGQEMRENMSKTTQDPKENANRTFQDLRENINKTAQDVKENVNKTAHDVKENMNKTGQEIKENLSKTAQDLKESGSRTFQDLRENMNKTAQDVKENINKTAHDVKENINKTTQELKENFKEILNSHPPKEFVIKPPGSEDNMPVVLLNLNNSHSMMRSENLIPDVTNSTPFCLVFSSSKLREQSDKLEEKIEHIAEQFRLPYEKMDQVLKKCEPKQNETEDEIIGLVNYTYYAGGIVLGTKWCGSGSIARSQNDLGTLSNLDMCCRDHDNCPDHVKAKEKKEELWNPTSYTRLSCDCDEKFRRCLHKVRNNLFEKRYSDMVGVVYFDLYNAKCYKKEHPIMCCKRFNQWRTKCVDYEYDQKEPPVKQWQSTPTYFSSDYSFRSESGTDLDSFLRRGPSSPLPPSCYS